MIRWLRNWLESHRRAWRQTQREIDLRVLWPICKEKASSMDLARVAFMVHCNMDSAWTQDFTEEQLVDYIGNLT